MQGLILFKSLQSRASLQLLCKPAVLMQACSPYASLQSASITDCEDHAPPPICIICTDQDHPDWGTEEVPQQQAGIHLFHLQTQLGAKTGCTVSALVE